MALFRYFFLILVLTFAFGLAGHFPVPSVQGMGVRPPVVGNPAPDFQLPDLQGNVQSLNQYHGKIILLNFWATWCKPCTKEMPAMQEAYDQLKDQGFVVVAVNELEDQDRVREHIRSHNHTFPVLLDEDNQVANMFGVVGLPVSVFIDETGRIQKYIKGGLLTTQFIHETFRQLKSQDGLANRRHISS